jgi:ribosomal protein S18 acetylase RimI-like enzyme
MARGMELEFRQTELGDILELFSVRARTRQNPISQEGLAALGITPESIAASMVDRSLIGWVCVGHSGVIGFCSGDSETGEVLVVAVLPDYEGNGIGKRLLTEVVEGLQSAGCSRLWLAASPHPSIRANGFYRWLGWQPTGQRLENGDEILEYKTDGIR